VFQEILTNIARHADASRIEVTLRGAPDALTLIVKDNGRGINDLDAVNSNSLGMLGMRERTQAWDGTIAFHSAPGEGTEVTVRIPIPAMTEA
jgi:signal transduction histidine kinase